jgi:hypothetical protein
MSASFISSQKLHSTSSTNYEVPQHPVLINRSLGGTGKVWCTYKGTGNIVENVAGGKVNILGGHSTGHSKKISLYEHVSAPNGFRYLARNIFLPSRRNGPMFEACESVWSVVIAHREGREKIIARQISETVRNRTRVHINLFSWNDRYYNLPEYWPFLLGYPV